MDLWISYPTFLTRNSSNIKAQNELVDGGSNADVESLTIQAATTLLEAYPDKQVEYFAYCRAVSECDVPAPAYKVAIELGIQEAIPFILGGQMGGEPIMALLLLSEMLNANRPRALLCCTQQLNISLSGNNNLSSNNTSISTALLLSSRADLTPSLRVLGIGIQQVGLADELLHAINYVSHAATQQNQSIKQISWGVIPLTIPPLERTIRQLLPNTRWFVREEDRIASYGCAETFASLYYLLKTKQIEHGEHGILWFVGQYGTLGCAYVVVEK